MFFLLFDKNNIISTNNFKSLHLSWNEFYNDTSEPASENGLFQNLHYTDSDKLTLSRNKTLVINCYLHNLSSTNSRKLLIETSTFIDCSSSNYGQ